MTQQPVHTIAESPFTFIGCSELQEILGQQADDERNWPSSSRRFRSIPFIFIPIAIFSGIASSSGPIPTTSRNGW